MKGELPAEEEDSGAIVLEGTEATRIGLEELDFTVEPFGDGVGNRVPQIGEDVFQMAFDHPGNFDDGLELAAGNPTEPVFEELAGATLVAIGP